MKLKGSDYLRWLYNVYTLQMISYQRISLFSTIKRNSIDVESKLHQNNFFGLFNFFCVKDISDFAICTFESDTIPRK